MTAEASCNRSLFYRAADEIDASVERRLWWWAGIFVALFLACSFARDVRSKLWIDELNTLMVARQASPGEIVKATMEGADGQPPLYAIMVHAILPVVKPEALAVRLPATLGYCGMFLCLLGFCRRRMRAVYALSTAVMACAACLTYSHEGRCYGVVLGCAAGALLAWQTAADGGERRLLGIIGLAFCLAMMPALHYYAIFFLGPLLLAEIVRWRMSGRLDTAVLAAMTPALLVLGAHYPLIAAGRRFQLHYWSPVAWSMVPQFYVEYFLPILCLSLVTLGCSFLARQPRSNRAGMRRDEWVAMGALSLMPALVIAVSKYTTHMFVGRYTIWAVIGFAVLAGALLSAAAGGRPGAGAIMLCASVGALTLLEARGLLRPPLLREGQSVLEALETLPDGLEPIVVARAHVFMELAYYAEPHLRERLVYTVGRDLDLRYLNADTSALIMSSLSHRTKLPIISLDGFLAAHPRFVLAGIDSHYLPRHLAATGYRVVPIRQAAGALVYEVMAQAAQ